MLRPRAILPLFPLSSFVTAQLTQPREGQVYNSFSGSGSFPVQYENAQGPIDLSVRDGSGFDYILANGIQAASGDTLNAAFAPLGICGDAVLTAREQGGDASASTANFTVTCSPIQLAVPGRYAKRQAGPSGTLTRPNGGEVFQQGGSISVAYTPVTDGGETFAIDGVLVGETQNYTLFNGLWKSNSSSTITGLFSIPEAACGDLQFIVTEHQIFQSSAIAFQAAAPAINVVCASNATNATSSANSTALPTNITSTATVVPTATSSAANATTTLFNSTTSAPSSTLASSSSLVSSNGTLLPVGSSTSSSSLSASSSAESSSTTSVPASTSSTLTSTIISTSSGSSSGEVTTVTSVVTSTLPASSSSSSSTSTSSSSSTSASSSSSSTSIPQGVTTVTASSSAPTSSSTSRSIVSSTPILVSTVTVTALPSSETGPTTIRVSESSTSSGASVVSMTRTFTATQLVVVAAPSQSRITSTRLQTVIYISPSVVEVVQASAAPTTALQPTGAASTNAVPLSLVLSAAAALLGAIFLL